MEKRWESNQKFAEHSERNDDNEDYNHSENIADLINDSLSVLEHVPLADTGHKDAHVSSSKSLVRRSARIQAQKIGLRNGFAGTTN